MICKYITRCKSDRGNVSLIISEEASCITKFYSNASMKGNKNCEYTPGFGGGLIVIVNSRIVDGIIVSGIRICFFHMCGVQQ